MTEFELESYLYELSDCEIANFNRTAMNLLSSPESNEGTASLREKLFERLTPRIVVRRQDRFCAVESPGEDFSTLKYVYSGSATHHFGAETFLLHEGDLLLIPPGIAYSMDPCGEGDIVLDICFDQELVGADILDALGGFAFLKPTHFQLKVLGIRQQILSIFQEYLNPDFATYTALLCQLPILFFEITRAWKESGRPISIHSKLSSADLPFVLNYIEANLAEITLNKVASRFNTTLGALGHLFKSYLGQTFTEIRQTLVLAKAVSLLSGTDLSVEAISEEVGFTSTSHFYVLFQKQFGVTPAIYRKNHRSW